MFLRTQDLMEEFGDVVGFYVRDRPVVILSDFEDIKQVYKTDEAALRPPSMLNHFNRCADKDGNNAKGILFSSGEEWREQRRFALKNLRDFGFGKSSMEDMIKGEAHKLIEDLKKDLGLPTILDYKLNVAILNSLWVMLVGEELNPENASHRAAMESLNNLVKQRDSLSSLAQIFPFLIKMFPMHYLKDAINTNDEIKKVIAPLREYHRQTIDVTHPRDFLDVHIAAQLASSPNSSFHGTDGEKNEEIALVDLFVAGAETTSTTINWGILYLIHHPDIQEKIYQEMDALLHGCREPCLEDERHLPFLNATLLEIHRSASIVYGGVPHFTKTDITVQGYTIPKGTVLFANILKVMHNPAVFKDPEVFNPSRFLDADGKVQAHPHLIPFLTGKRFCLGQSLAEKSLYVFMSQLLYKFKFSAVPGESLPDYSTKSRINTCQSIIRFAPEYKIIIEERK